MTVLINGNHVRAWKKAVVADLSALSSIHEHGNKTSARYEQLNEHWKINKQIQSNQAQIEHECVLKVSQRFSSRNGFKLVFANRKVFRERLIRKIKIFIQFFIFSFQRPAFDKKKEFI